MKGLYGMNAFPKTRDEARRIEGIECSMWNDLTGEPLLLRHQQTGIELSSIDWNSVNQRGEPENDAVIHLKNGWCKGDNVLCLNGAYHTRYTKDPRLVNCKSCRIEILKRSK